MLISYKFRNYCSFCEMAEFDMLAPANKVKNRFPDNFIETEEGYDILKTAVMKINCRRVVHSVWR